MKCSSVFLSLALLVTPGLFGNIGPAGFGEFSNYYFVETGTYGGAAIIKALQVGFKEVRSIEFEDAHYHNACRRFAHDRRVRLWHGDSSKDLWDMIKDIDGEITFWLDAHIYPPIDGAKNCPLIEELEQIGRHQIKTHTILIDDMHCAGTHAFDYLTKEDLIAKIKEINPDYEITYVPGGDQGEYPQNVMVARVSQ